MLTLVCSAVSQFDMGIASRVFAYPALLLILAQKKPNEVCERRAEVARGFLAKESCCIQNEKGDLTEKIVRWYRHSSSLSPSQVCAQKGCSSPLP